MIALSSIGTVSTIIAAVAGSWAGVRRMTKKSERLRDRIGDDLALLDRLPAGSAGQVTLSAHIDSAVAELVGLHEAQSKRSRDPFILVWGVFFVGLTIALGTWAWMSEYNTALKVVMWTVVVLLSLIAIVTVPASVQHPDKDSRDSG